MLKMDDEKAPGQIEVTTLEEETAKEREEVRATIKKIRDLKRAMFGEQTRTCWKSKCLHPQGMHAKNGQGMCLKAGCGCSCFKPSPYTTKQS